MCNCLVFAVFLLGSCQQRTFLFTYHSRKPHPNPNRIGDGAEGDAKRIIALPVSSNPPPLPTSTHPHTQAHTQGMQVDDDNTAVVRALFFMGHGRASSEVT